MKRLVLFSGIAVLAICLGPHFAGLAQEKGPDRPPPKQLALYPPIEPFRTGRLKVSDLHEIYYELCGNPEGKPVMVLHGGPGSGSYPSLRRYHDPEKYLIILHDQRGSGRSRPYCELKDNNTAALVGDIEKLRQHLELGKVQIFGGSWGTTLGVAYAEAYPEQVTELILRGVFMGTRQEIDHFYHGGTGANFPDAYARLQSILPEPDQHTYPRQLLDMLTGEDEAKRKLAAREWARYEMRTSRLVSTDEEVDASLDRWDFVPFSTIENHYMSHNCFLKEGQLLKNAARIADIPTIIVQGRYDVICPPRNAWNLHQRLAKSKLVLVPDAGHSGGEKGNTAALIAATREFGGESHQPSGARGQ